MSITVTIKLLTPKVRLRMTDKVRIELRRAIRRSISDKTTMIPNNPKKTRQALTWRY